MVPGRGPAKIAGALAVAAAGLGGGLAYKKFKAYLHQKQLRKEREKSRRQAREQQKATSVPRKRSVKSQKRPRTRKTTATKSKRAA